MIVVVDTSVLIAELVEDPLGGTAATDRTPRGVTAAGTDENGLRHSYSGTSPGSILPTGVQMGGNVATVKTSLTIPKELLDAAKVIAGKRGVSGLVVEALRREVRRRKLLDVLDAQLAADPPTLEELEVARKAVQAVIAYTDAEVAEALPDSLAGPARKPA